MKSIQFVNFTNEDFSWKFDGVEYTFKPNQPTYLEDYKAEHFAKHLVDREMNRLNTERGLHGTAKEVPTSNKNERAELEAKCFPSEIEVTPAEALNLNETAKVKKTKKAEPEFEDLTDK